MHKLDPACRVGFKLKHTPSYPFCDGVFGVSGETFRFRNPYVITDKEVEKLLLEVEKLPLEVSSKVLKLLKKGLICLQTLILHLVAKDFLCDGQ